MRTFLFLALCLAGPLFASEPACENGSCAECASEVVAPKKAPAPSLKASESRPKKTAAAPQANAHIREGRRPATPNPQRPAYLFM